MLLCMHPSSYCVLRTPLSLKLHDCIAACGVHFFIVCIDNSDESSGSEHEFLMENDSEEEFDSTGDSARVVILLASRNPPVLLRWCCNLGIKKAGEGGGGASYSHLDSKLSKHSACMVSMEPFFPMVVYIYTDNSFFKCIMK